MSDEENRIREELEVDIEKNLEGEIKEEICRLALRLQRLYQHQKDKHQITCSKTQLKQQLNKSNKYNKALSEVNICIKMEGGTKVDIKEIKKPRKIISSTKNKVERVVLDNKNNTRNSSKRFDWANSLRSGPKLNSGRNVVRNKVQIGREHQEIPKRDKCIANKHKLATP